MNDKMILNVTDKHSLHLGQPNKPFRLNSIRVHGNKMAKHRLTIGKSTYDNIIIKYTYFIHHEDIMLDNRTSNKCVSYFPLGNPF